MAADHAAICAQRSEARLAGRRADGVPVVLDVSVRHHRRGTDRHTLCVVSELNHGALAHEAQRYFDVAFDRSPIGKALFNPSTCGSTRRCARCSGARSTT